MLEIMEYVKARYMGEKAQGMTEYAIILALVVAIAVAVFGSGTDGALGTAISGVFTKVTNQLNSILN